MNTIGQIRHQLPSNWLAKAGAIMALFVAALSWLYLHAQAISPERHASYTQGLRDLRELDAYINAELLANRLEQVLNYDALNEYVRRADATMAPLADVPDFLEGEERARVVAALASVRDTLAQKRDLVDRFKRRNAVLRNSIAFFPLAVSDLLDTQVAGPVSPELRYAMERYSRRVLGFSNQPSEVRHAEVRALEAPLDALPIAGSQKARAATIRRHGERIVAELLATDGLIHEVVTLGSEERLENLTRAYTEGYSRAVASRDNYRKALFTLSLFLTAFLAWMFVRLELTRRSLAQAHQEVIDRYTAQLAVEKQLTLHATAFRNAHDGITLTDAAGNILDVNPAFTRITGWERSEVIGRNPRVLKSGRHDKAFYEAMWQSINTSGTWNGEIWNRNKYGETYPELLSISAVRDTSGRLTNYVAIFSDISRLKAQERQLTRLAYYDPLTELPNRALLSDRLLQGIAQTRRGSSLMAICYLDLDGFKAINDTWGHEAGDDVLVDIAHRLKAALRGGDTVARLGGDEFVLLLQDLASANECDEALSRVLKLVTQPLTMLPAPATISGSIGVTLFPLDDADPDTLLRHADQAMYQAKQAGKNRYHLFDSEQDRSVRTLHDRVERIRQALEKREFVLYFQPKVNMRQGCVVGLEALIRWDHPERGILSPVEFMPIVENDDLIQWIGDWVIETALVQMETWQTQGLELSVSVNVASRQLQSHRFLESLKAALGRHASVARQLELEILETAALEDIAQSARVIDECRDMGVKFSLDDFGTGYSSLSYLKRLPAETIKIDQSFVREILSDVNNLVIVQGVIGLANAFQRQVVAEGVETVEHGRLLMQINCDMAQGFGIAKPMPGNDIPGWVGQWQPEPAWQDIRHLYWETADYSMLVAEIQLRNWVAQLVYTTNEGLPSPHSRPADPCHCDFGKWYHDAGRQRYAKEASWAEVGLQHDRLHDVAQRMDACWRSGKLDGSRALIPELLAARDAALNAIHRLQMSVAKERLQ